MRCADCGTDNPEKMKFCGECGASLRNLCPNCGFENPPAFKFCGECAAPLTGAAAKPARAAGESQAAAPPPRPDRSKDGTSPGAAAERRQVTVMFCDLVGYTVMSGRIDPEELRELLRGYRQNCRSAVERYGGHVARYVGDGVKIHFGYPTAHEDDPQRAVRAALQIVDGMKSLPSPASLGASGESQGPLQVRIGIHTGQVVTGDLTESEGEGEKMAVIGEAPNIAARVQGLAEPNSVAITGATLRLLPDEFVITDLGQPPLKGVAEPVSVHLVRSARIGPVPRAASRTRLVGREQEWGLLRDRWERAREGSGQVILLSGEAGIGKSRLVEALRVDLVESRHRWMEWRCAPYMQESSLSPLIEVLHSQLGFESGDGEERRSEKLGKSLQDSGMVAPEAVALLFGLLSLPIPAGHTSLTLSADAQRRKLLEVLVLWIVGLSARRPLVIAVEDAHWIDPSSLELLGLIVEQAPALPLLVVVTARPEFQPPWPLRAHVTPIMLNRLTQKQVIQMAGSVAGETNLPASALIEIAEKTDGVPLFVEEMTKAVMESGTVRDVPTTLQDLLMARLDSLGAGKEIAQLGSALGRKFNYRLLRAVSSLDETALHESLSSLVGSELLYQRGQPPQATYLFKHALIQEMAYQSMLRKRRIEVHGRIAESLATGFPEIAESNPELVAHHWSEAGNHERAADAWHQAGLRAMVRSQIGEAIVHLQKGVEALRGLPDPDSHAEHEITILNLLGWAYMMAKGYPAGEVQLVYGRARELCIQTRSPQIGLALIGLWSHEHNIGHRQRSKEIAEELLAEGESRESRTFRQWGRLTLGLSLYAAGEFEAAVDHLDTAGALYRGEKDQPGIIGAVVDPKVFALSAGALALAFHGFPDRARAQAREALAYARQIGHPYSTAWALAYGANCHQIARDSVTSRAWATELIGLAREQRISFFTGYGHAFRGGVLAEQGNSAQGIVELRHGATICRQQGGLFTQSYLHGLVAAAQLRAGQVEAAAGSLSEGFTYAEAGERFYLAELHRLEGDLRLAELGLGRTGSDPEIEIRNPKWAEAEACFERALEIAQGQSAKLLELRAASSLGKAWRARGRCDDARQLIEPIYDWFSEGFDTPDMREAKALIDSLVQ